MLLACFGFAGDPLLAAWKPQLSDLSQAQASSFSWLCLRLLSFSTPRASSQQTGQGHGCIWRHLQSRVVAGFSGWWVEPKQGFNFKKGWIICNSNTNKLGILMGCITLPCTYGLGRSVVSQSAFQSEGYSQDRYWKLHVACYIMCIYTNGFFHLHAVLTR